MRLPTELRQEIYRYLLPDRPIPARFSRPLRSDGKVQTAILRASRQIYSEAVVILYQFFSFGISITPESVTICNITRTRWKPLLSFDDDIVAGLLLRGALRGGLSRLHAGVQCGWDNFPIDDSIWCRIRSFSVEIILGNNHRPPRGGQGRNEVPRMALGCDMVRRVIERLHSISRIKELEIVIKPGQWPGRDALGAAAGLLGLFHTIPNAQSLKISVVENSNLVSFSGFSSTEGLLSKNPVFQSVLQSLLLQSSQESSETKARLPPKRHRHIIPLAALLKIEALVQLFSHPLIYNFLCPSHSLVLKSLHVAAIHARETGNLPAFREVCDRVENIVLDFSERQLNVQRRISEGVDAIRQIIERSPLCPELSAGELDKLGAGTESSGV
jgi:hypothetical protein